MLKCWFGFHKFGGWLEFNRIEPNTHRCWGSTNGITYIVSCRECVCGHSEIRFDVEINQHSN